MQCVPSIGRILPGLSVANDFGWCQQRYVETTGKRTYDEAQSQLYRWKTAQVRLILLKRWSLNIITLSMLKWKNPAVRKTLESFERNFFSVKILRPCSFLFSISLNENIEGQESDEFGSGLSLTVPISNS